MKPHLSLSVLTCPNTQYNVEFSRCDLAEAGRRESSSKGRWVRDLSHQDAVAP